MLFLKQTLVLPFYCHKKATTYQIDSSKGSISKLKPVLCSCLKTKITEPTDPPQYSHKRGTIILGHPVEAHAWVCHA